ncbi:hypothetical protein [Flavobacterium columnare]|nr:hypothetical protein [Flavobacterium columnare]QOG57741.1 hypothetical protein HUE29_10420 [Flavobacterium columnare]QOG60465.1 hypothetical protein HUE30_10420 [Flavobacterium columnare]QOG63185.1 hypothetical protein HUE31_10420 [Flavobacterium columnare]QOG65908.1 hypothetical protein HUE32_10430 [Flavobacterium columnare]QOG68632.1 hypothetical protein HUE33_10415 [Flavobacterium columnare]
MRNIKPDGAGMTQSESQRNRWRDFVNRAHNESKKIKGYKKALAVKC